MIHLRCRLLPNVSQATAIAQLKTAGLRHIALVEDSQEGVQLYGQIDPQTLPLLHCPPLLFLVDEVTPFDPQIDWNDQWATSGANYQDGFVTVNLGEKGSLKLQPGPGFGDLSHPTTQLIIELMEDQVPNRAVVDIGSGSGVLAFAALRFGAQQAVGIEINRQAIRHAQHNAQLNNLSDKVQFVHPADIDLVPNSETVYLMNMITSEQQVVLDNLGLHGPLPGHWFISGVLTDNRDSYLESHSSREWLLQTEKARDGWIAFHFHSKPM